MEVPTLQIQEDAVTVVEAFRVDVVGFALAGNQLELPALMLSEMRVPPP
jgi:hypothetical protein